MAATYDPALAPSIRGFLARCGLPPSTLGRCWASVRELYPAAEIRESPSQGYCSVTFCVGADLVVQFRPVAHQLDVELAGTVKQVYGEFAPETRLVGRLDCGDQGCEGNASSSPVLLIYSMSRVPGYSLAEHRIKLAELASPALALATAAVPGPASAPPGSNPGLDSFSDRESLVRDFARFLARGWSAAQRDPDVPRRTGKVGSTLRQRVEMMHRDLPARFRPAVEKALASLAAVEALPWTLTHGDVVPSNLMVEPPVPLLLRRSTGGAAAADDDDDDDTAPLRLTALLDWAEAEHLPFGVGLYGAEELFGQTETPWDAVGPYPPRGSRFAYFADADALRTALWDELEARIPALRSDARLRGTVEAARRLGLLLWHGIAFDDGRLDRVVQEGRDDEEIQRLDLFLLGRRSDDAASGVWEDNDDDDDGPAAPQGQERVRRPSLSDVVKRTWAYVRCLGLSGPFFGKL